MGAPAVTNTFSASTTISSSQVNQNFSDIINGITDGTKDLSISALTCAGTATLNGNINLGNASGDDLTITASLASTLAIKTNNTYNIGAATLGLAGIYLGAPSSRSTLLTSNQSIAGSITLVLPLTTGTVDYVMRSDGSGNMSWVSKDQSYQLENLSLSVTASGGTMTVALKDVAGSDCSAASSAKIGFRSVTATTGTYVMRTNNAALSLSLAGASTLGAKDATAAYVYIYLFDNAGALTMGASLAWYDEGTVQSSSTTATSNQVIYQAVALSSKAIRLIGRFKATNTTAAWGSPTEVSIMPFRPIPVGGRAYRASGNQSINNTTYTKIDLSAVTAGSDLQNCWDVATNDRYIACEPGKYNLCAGMYWAGSATGVRTIAFYKNGSIFSQNQVPQNATAFISNFSDIVDLVIGDYIELFVWHNAGLAINVSDDATDSFISISKAHGY